MTTTASQTMLVPLLYSRYFFSAKGVMPPKPRNAWQVIAKRFK